jgi:hypothetical protein
VLRLACVVVVLAGCEGVFDVHDVDAVHTVDAPSCKASTNVVDGFDDAMTPCGPVGLPFVMGGAGLSEGSGLLTIFENASGPSNGGCYYYGVPIDAGGVFVATEQALATPHGYTVLTLKFGTSQGVFVGVVDGGSLVFESYDGSTSYAPAQTYVPQAMRFWQMRLETTGDVIAEYSSDATIWQLFGTAHGVAVPNVVEVDIGAGDAAEGSTRAIFSHLNVCP